MSITALDAAAIVFAGAGLSLYHVHLYLTSFSSPSANSHLRQLISNTVYFVKKHQEKDDPLSGQLAIQTLRNTIIVAVFVGGSVLTLGLTFSTQYSETNAINLKIRAVLLTFFCFCSFLSWVMVIRFSAQVGYLMGTLHIPHEYADDVTESGSTSSDSGEGKDLKGIPPSEIASSARLIDDKRIEKIKESQAQRCTNIIILSAIAFR
jgi:hypothetical protein